MNSSDIYAAEWRDLRRREWLVIGLFLGYIPAVAGFAWLISFVTSSETPIFVVAVSWMAAFLWAGIRVQLFSCPSCGKRFYRNKYWITTLGRKCPHCGLRRYARA